MPSLIEWTDETWNPITGCTKVSPGCAPIETARLYWVVWMHDYGQKIIFEVMSWVK